MRRWAGLVVVAVALAALPGCTRASKAERALDQIEDNLTKIRSGTLGLGLLASSPGAAEGRGVGFEVAGPFAVAEKKGRLPMADLAFTRITGSGRRTTRFISTGEAAFVEVDGAAYRLGPEHVEGLRARDDGDSDEGGLEGLRLGKWIDAPKLAAGLPLEGVATDRITGRVDAVAVLNDVLELAQQFETGSDGLPSRLEGDGADRVRRAMVSARGELLAGREDRLLRHLDVVVELAVDRQQEIRAALGELAGVTLRLKLDVTGLNRSVAVAAPEGARPLAELSSG